MTKDEVNSIPFHFYSHMSMEHQHSTTYTASYKGHQFVICKNVPYVDGEPKGRTRSRFIVDDKVFKSKKKLYEYCETL